MEKLAGYVEHIIYRNADNGYTVLNLVSGEEEITCVGIFSAIAEGENIEASGDYTDHPTYGKQFKVESFEEKAPEDEEAIERYLGSGAIRGIGLALAARIVRRFKADTFRIIEEEPERLAEVKGISERKAMEIADQVNEQVKAATDNYEALESGKISAAVGFSTGAAQIADALDQRRGNSGIGLAVIAHHGVHHLVGGRPQGKGFFSQRYLCFAAQIAGIDTIKLQLQLLIVLQCGHAVGTAVHPGGGAKAAGVSGKHHRGQCHRLEAHDRQYRQDHRKAAPAYAGQIVDAKDLFGFNGFLQIGKPPC